MSSMNQPLPPSVGTDKDGVGERCVFPSHLDTPKKGCGFLLLFGRRFFFFGLLGATNPRVFCREI